MLEYKRINISEGIDTDKTNKSKNVCFTIIGIFYIKALAMEHIFVIVVTI